MKAGMAAGFLLCKIDEMNFKKCFKDDFLT